MEQHLFFGFAQDQSKLTLWIPIWAIKHYVPDIDIIGKKSFK
jgi:hypothetical protein